MDAAARRSRLSVIFALGSFFALSVLTQLSCICHVRAPFPFELFAGMICWLVIFYGYAGRKLWIRLQSASKLKAGRESGWLAMMSAFVFAALHVIEIFVLVILVRLIVRLSLLRACLRIRLGLADPNLLAFRLIPPLSVHA